MTRTVPIAGALALSLLLSSAPGVATDRYRPQSEVLKRGASVVSGAAHRDAANAFATASTLVRPSDQDLRTRLAARQHDVETAAASLGALRSVAPAQEMVFAGCVTHRYLVRYADGRQHWTLKYRRGVDGWYLADLHVQNAT